MTTTTERKCTASVAVLKHSGHLDRTRLELTYQGQLKVPEGGRHEDSEGGGRGCQQSASGAEKSNEKQAVGLSRISHGKEV